MINTNLYMSCVFILKGISNLLSKGSSVVRSVTSASAKIMPMQYATIVIVWSVTIAFVIRSDIFALRIVSRILMTSPSMQSFQSSLIISKISTNFLWVIILRRSYIAKAIIIFAFWKFVSLKICHFWIS